MQNARDENEGARVRRGGLDEEEGDDIGKFVASENAETLALRSFRS